jgi:EAL domain-containing protein (putative c-di-GMP-specific phosphodiesterase class I)
MDELFPFTMAFQPIVDLERLEIRGYEALVRGPDDESAASVLSKVDGVNKYAFDQACRTKAIGLAAGLGLTCSLSINFLPNAIYDPKACLRHTLAAASRHRFPHHLLTFEIVETEGLTDPAHLSAIVAEYRSRGFRIALDDFGTGYSGLARLADLRPDIVKVDRALVAECDRTRVRQSILAGLVALCREIGTEVVFEGVETEAEVRTLLAIGARYMQGFYFARPMLESLCPQSSIVWPAVGKTCVPAE